MQKPFVMITLVAFCAITMVACNGEAYSETHVASQITDHATFRKILSAALAVLVILPVVIYQFLLYRERKNRQILNLEIDQLATQHKELSDKYQNALTSGSDQSVDSHDHRFLKKVIKTVEDKIGDSEFTVERMAKEIGMSRTSLFRKVKALTGLPPGDLIRQMRLQKAAALLLNQAESVSQICYIVGFEDHSYFSKSFKKQFGVPPSEYLRSKRQSNQLNPQHELSQERMKTLVNNVSY